MTTKNFVVKNGLTTGNIVLSAANSTISANVVVANLQVPASANLGAAGNIIITGGTSGQVLSTDGLGNLSWTDAGTGGSSGSGVDVSVDTFTGDGANATFTLSVAPASVNHVIVNYGGIILTKDTYTLNGTSITFYAPPAVDATVEISVITGSGSSGGGSSSSSIMPWTIVSANTTATTNNGYFVDTTGTEITITLPASPVTGSTVRLNDLAGNFSANVCRVVGNGNKIQGQAADLLLDYDQAGVGLVFSNSTYGWKLMEL